MSTRSSESRTWRQVWSDPRRLRAGSCQPIPGGTQSFQPTDLRKLGTQRRNRWEFCGASYAHRRPRADLFLTSSPGAERPELPALNLVAASFWLTTAPKPLQSWPTVSTGLAISSGLDLTQALTKVDRYKATCSQQPLPRNGESMQPQIKDPDVLALASIAATLKGDYVRKGEDDPWAGSPFAWIRTRPSRQVGKIGEQLVAGWCAAKGLDVVSTGDSQADRVIAGRRVEIKFSTLWESGVYKFQQLRNQNYEFALCLGISPFDAHCWVISKAVLRQHVIDHTPQHTGKGGTDTFWLSVIVSSPQDWLCSCGGRLADAYQILKKWQARR
jgi:hypothetical protein